MPSHSESLRVRRECRRGALAARVAGGVGVLGDFVGFSTRSGALTARAGMDIFHVGYIGHGMFAAGLYRSRSTSGRS